MTRRVLTDPASLLRHLPGAMVRPAGRAAQAWSKGAQQSNDIVLSPVRNRPSVVLAAMWP